METRKLMKYKFQIEEYNRNWWSEDTSLLLCTEGVQEAFGLIRRDKAFALYVTKKDPKMKRTKKVTIENGALYVGGKNSQWNTYIVDNIEAEHGTTFWVRAEA